MLRIGAILLAAGAGKRFGGHKLETKVLGKSMYMHAIDLLYGQNGIQKSVVVTGNPEIQKTALERSMKVAWNDLPEKGISHSLKLGMETLLSDSCHFDGVLCMVSDQPWLKRITVTQMLDFFHGGICVLRGGDQTGNPVIFSSDYFDELSHLNGDVGGKQVIQRHGSDVYYYDIKDLKELKDVDKKEHLEE